MQGHESNLGLKVQCTQSQREKGTEKRDLWSSRTHGRVVGLRDCWLSTLAAPGDPPSSGPRGTPPCPRSVVRRGYGTFPKDVSQVQIVPTMFWIVDVEGSRSRRNIGESSRGGREGREPRKTKGPPRHFLGHKRKPWDLSVGNLGVPPFRGVGHSPTVSRLLCRPCGPARRGGGWATGGWERGATAATGTRTAPGVRRGGGTEGASRTPATTITTGACRSCHRPTSTATTPAPRRTDPKPEPSLSSFVSRHSVSLVLRTRDRLWGPVTASGDRDRLWGPVTTSGGP